MIKVRPGSLRPGDLWFHGQKSKPWILLSSKVVKGHDDPEDLSVWELTWFGCKNDDRLVTIVDCWTRDSKFSIFSRAEKE